MIILKTEKSLKFRIILQKEKKIFTYSIRQFTMNTNKIINTNSLFELEKIKKTKNLILNFGPQHPAAHGVLRLILELDGEFIIRVDSHIGLLHRGTEKLSESKTYTQLIPYLDRLDYVSMMAQELCYAQTIEQILKIEIPKRAVIIRIIFLEITRLLNHLLALTTHALDIGALTPFLWAFEEREKLMEFYERVSGARLHASYIRPGGVNRDLPAGFCDDLYWFVLNAYSRIDEINLMLTDNRVWTERLVDIGIVDVDNAVNFGFTGVMLRASGIKWDLRVSQSTGNYISSGIENFKAAVGVNGDCFDRYLVRLEEMYQSLDIIKRCLIILPQGDVIVDNYKINPPRRNTMKLVMESVIHHFKHFSEGFIVPTQSLYSAVEAPKGEFGIFVSALKNRSHPERVRMRAPGFYHLQGIDYLSKNVLLSDVVAIIGTLDLVLGEIDR